MSEFATGASLPNPTNDWTNLDNIRAEWTTQLEGPEQGRLGWTNGMRMFHEDAIPAQRLNAAEYITRGLAYHLFTPVLSDREAVDASRAVLSLIDRVPAEPAWALPFAPRLARLALAVIRMNGWQPAALGGDDSVVHEIVNSRPDGLVRYSVRCPGVADADVWKNFFRVSAAKPAADLLSTPSGFRSRVGDLAAPIIDALRETAVEAGKVGTKTAAKWAIGLGLFGFVVALLCLAIVFPRHHFLAFPFFLLVFTLMGAVTVYLAAQRAVSAAAVEATQRLHLVRRILDWAAAQVPAQGPDKPTSLDVASLVDALEGLPPRVLAQLKSSPIFVRWIGERVLGRTTYRLIAVLNSEGPAGEVLVREFGPLADRVDRMIVDSARDSVRTSTVAGLGISTLVAFGLAFVFSIV